MQGTSRIVVRHGHLRRVLLHVALAICTVLLLLPSAEALIASFALRNSRLGNTYKYSMYNGSVVTGERYVTGTTTYPYVFDSTMNAFVVQVLQRYLNFSNKTVAAVGGSLATCMDPNTGKDATGQKCYKAFLAAIAPSDCPAANVLCCPLVWRVGNQNVQTTMAQMDPQTIFWNGAKSVNGFFSNFSASYLLENENCSQPILSSTTSVTLAVDVTGEWRFVPLLTSFLLQETVLVGNATATAIYFNGTNPQEAIRSAKLAQRPLYHMVNKVLIPVVACVVLLFATGFFLVLACGCGTMRSARRVRRTQRRLVELKASPPPRGSVAILDAISPESSSRSSSSGSEESRRSNRHSVSRQSTTKAADGLSDSSGSGDGDSDERRPGMSSHASTKSKGSTKSHKSKGGAPSRKQSSMKSKTVDFPPPSAPLPGIRPLKGSMQQNDTPSRAAAAHMAKRSSSTGTVVHQVNKSTNSGSRKNVR